ncbi:MAG: hypothetical protein ISS77_03900 [Phycisphaerae bacterium]|nr:hypothetical protein [Phycisphaerae bacterium]
MRKYLQENEMGRMGKKFANSTRLKGQWPEGTEGKNCLIIEKLQLYSGQQYFSAGHSHKRK